jgi:hypothetical protein
VPTNPPKTRRFGFPLAPDFDASDVTRGLADHEQPASPRIATAGSLTDLELLPQRFDMFASEVTARLDSIGSQLLPIVNRLEAAQTREVERGEARDATIRDLTARLEQIEARLDITPAQLPPPPARAKRPTLKR